MAFRWRDASTETRLAGKRANEIACPPKEGPWRTNRTSAGCTTRAARRDAPQGQLVGRARRDRPRSLELHRLRDVPRVRGQLATTWGAYLSPFYSPLFDVELGARAGASGSSRRRCSSCRARRASASLATTTARPTTARSRWDPPACAVGERSAAHATTARRKLLIFQNLHRYAMYVAVLFLVFLWKDAIVGDRRLERRRARRRRHARDAHELRAPHGYTFGCHASATSSAAA